MKRILQLMHFFGFYPKILLSNISNLHWYIRDYKKIKKTNSDNFKIEFKPILNERNDQGGVASGHYFHQDLLVASKIFKNNPVKHVDIGSRFDGFIAHMASFREIEVFDIRDVSTKINNILFKQTDFMKLPKEYCEYTDSISCLHALEHFGLGRYNDPIDINGHLKGFDAISKMLKTGGYFYFSVPIGELRIEFNAHRVFSLSYLLNLFEGKYDIISFSYVNDKGELFTTTELISEKIADNLGCKYGCGIFELVKKA